MSKQLNTWLFVESALQKGEEVVLFYVVESIGSSPGRKGFFMAVTKEHDISGSIGGGIMEHKFLQLARSIFLQDGRGVERRKQIHNKEAAHDQSGMICSGEQTLAICPLARKDLVTVSNIVSSFTDRSPGTLQIDEAGLRFYNELLPASNTFIAGEQWLYQENTGTQPVLHLIGGGHCALALSQTLHLLGFTIRLYEDRPDLHTLKVNEFADEILQMENYLSLQDLIPNDSEDDYAVVMTFGYRTDMEAIKILLKKKFRYLGLMGSQNKIAEMLKHLKAENYSDNLLDVLHAPAGIRINSKTPEEIAISIAAEIIQIKNTQNDNQARRK